jgi:hypothetical protein
MNNLAILQALAFEPRKAFAELDARPRFWWPMLVLALATTVLAVWYTSFVDLPWLVDQQLRLSPRTASMTDDEIARLVETMTARPGLQVVFAGLGTCIGLVVVLLLSALFYLLVSKITGVNKGFGHWFSLTCWSSLPAALAIVPAAFVLLTATSNQIGQEALQPLSLNELFFKLKPGDTGFGPASYVNVFTIVGLYLTAFGVREWSRRSWLFSIIFAALPLTLVFGVWAIFVLR